MENIGDWKARQSNDKPETSTHLSRQWTIAETTRLDVMMARTAAYYPNQELSKETYREYREVLKEIGTRHGLDAVGEALKTLRITSKFFPHPAEVNEQIAERIAAESASQSGTERRVAATQEMLARVFPEGTETVSMGDIYQDFIAKQKAKLDAKAKAAGE